MGNADFIAAVLAAAMKENDDEGKQQKQQDPLQQQQSQQPSGVSRDDVEAALDKRFEVLVEKLSAGKDDKSTDDGKQTGEGGEDDGKQTGLTPEQRELAETKVESAFVAKGFDKDSFKALSEFFDYAILNDDEGKLSEENVDSLVEAISSVALREPPKSKRKNLPSSKSQGFSKYLNKDD